MRNEHLKIFTAFFTIFTAIITFYVFAEQSGIFFFSQKMLVMVGIFASAYAAFFSIYLSRRLEHKRMARRVFIIYSHKDKNAARKLTSELKELGYNPWLDENEILPGQNWNKSIYQAIENSSVALFLASKNTELSEGFSLKEMKAAKDVLHASKDTYSPIIPIYIEECDLPEELMDIHAVKLYEDKGLDKLDKGLKYLFENST